MTLDGSLDGVSDQPGLPLPDLLAERPDRRQFRRRSRGRRHRPAALRGRHQRQEPGDADQLHRRLSHRQRQRRQCRRREPRLPRRRRSPRIQSCTNPLAATGRHRSRDQRPDPPPRAAGLSDPGAGHHHGRLRHGRPRPTRRSKMPSASLRWTGSWYTVFIAAEPQGGGNLGRPLEQSLSQYVNRYRLAGQDIKLDRPHYVPLEIELDGLRRSRLLPERRRAGADAGAGQRDPARRPDGHCSLPATSPSARRSI